MKKIWEYASMGTTVYLIFKQLQTMSKMKNDLYETLSPEQQAMWKKVLGDPTAKLANPFEKLVVKPQTVTSISQVTVGA